MDITAATATIPADPHPLNAALVYTYAGGKIYERGRNDVKEPVRLERSTGKATALVAGTLLYQVELEWDTQWNPGVLRAKCECPYAHSGHFCKHMVVTALELCPERLDGRMLKADIAFEEASLAQQTMAMDTEQEAVKNGESLIKPLTKVKVQPALFRDTVLEAASDSLLGALYQAAVAEIIKADDYDYLTGHLLTTLRKDLGAAIDHGRSHAVMGACLRALEHALMRYERDEDEETLAHVRRFNNLAAMAARKSTMPARRAAQYVCDVLSIAPALLEGVISVWQDILGTTGMDHLETLLRQEQADNAASSGSPESVQHMYGVRASCLAHAQKWEEAFAIVTQPEVLETLSLWWRFCLHATRKAEGDEAACLDILAHFIERGLNYEESWRVPQKIKEPLSVEWGRHVRRLPLGEVVAWALEHEDAQLAHTALESVRIYEPTVSYLMWTLQVACARGGDVLEAVEHTWQSMIELRHQRHEKAQSLRVPPVMPRATPVTTQAERLTFNDGIIAILLTMDLLEEALTLARTRGAWRGWILLVRALAQVDPTQALDIMRTQHKAITGAGNVVLYKGAGTLLSVENPNTEEGWLASVGSVAELDYWREVLTLEKRVAQQMR